jgi:uncharacterized membrane protein YkoI
MIDNWSQHDGGKKMIKKSMIAVVAMVALVALVFAASGSLDNKDNKDNNSSVNSSSNQEKQQTSSTNITKQQNTTKQTEISSEEAQQIAQKFIEQPGATAGTPQLKEIDGKSIYVVPVMIDGKAVGEIEIDAQTGENLGGAGGVS